MSGLEAVEIKLSELLVDNEKYRMDSEFFKKVFLNSYTTIKKSQHIKFVDVIDVLTDFHANGSYESIAMNFELLDSIDFAYMVRSTDLEAKDFTTNVKYVTQHTYEFLAKSKVYGGELLINKIGTPGKSYLMPNLNKPVSLGMNLFMIRFKKTSPITNVFAWLFLNTQLGKNIIERKINGTIPLTIDKEAIKSLYIPVMSQDFQSQLQHCVDYSELQLIKSKETYTSAESLLLSALGLDGFTPSSEPVAVKSLSESFGASGRLDAEYYQGKYEEVLQRISGYNCDELGNLVNIKKSIEPGSNEYIDEGIPFVRVSDLSKHGISQTEKHLDRGSFANMDLQPKKDTVLLTKDGTVGIAYKVEEDLDVVTSGAILHLTIRNKGRILPDYLALVLNSVVVQMQAERDTGGSVIQHWRPSEIADVVIPILDIDTQTEVAELVRRSFELRRESERLLEAAKSAVEMAIEVGEDVAMEWLTNKQGDACYAAFTRAYRK